MQQPQRIVCFHLNQVGDLLFSLPALYNLRHAFPEAHITCVIRPEYAGLLSLSGLADKVIHRQRRFWGGAAVVAQLLSQRPELAILFSTSPASALLALCSGAIRRVGFDHQLQSRLLTDRVTYRCPPSIQNNLRLVGMLGCSIKKEDYVGLLHPGLSEHSCADNILRSIGIDQSMRFAVIAPGTSSGREIKRWSDIGFADVADGLMSRFAIRSVIVGNRRGESIRNFSNYVYDLTGLTPLPALAALLQRASVFIGVDSGIMHLAAAVGVPVVALFGPTDPSVTGPKGQNVRVLCLDVPCRPCFGTECKIGRPCIESITPHMVLDAISSVLGF